jgi:holo-[acyl-carrier protein] synthase
MYNRNQKEGLDLRIGIDITDVGRIKKMLEKYPMMRHRIFTDEEIRHCEKRGHSKAESYAALWSVREAAGKALGIGFGGASWKDASVHYGDCGEPDLILSGVFKNRAESLGIKSMAVSLTHERSAAAAVVIMTEGEKNDYHNS